MKKTNKIILIASSFALAFILSGCGGGKKDLAPAAPKDTVPPAAPEATKNKATKTETALPELPADDKAAIDTEITNIDSELNSLENNLTEDSLSDADLGL